MGYQPQPEDLDYPGKLQLRAEAAADAAPPPPPTEAVEGVPNAAQDDPEVPCAVHVLPRAPAVQQLLVNLRLCRGGNAQVQQGPEP